jgi:hypothetical protein
MNINIENLITISNYSKIKDLTRQHVYRLIRSGALTLVTIDGVKFIYLDEKSMEFVRKRQK